MEAVVADSHGGHRPRIGLGLGRVVSTSIQGTLSQTTYRYEVADVIGLNGVQQKGTRRYPGSYPGSGLAFCLCGSPTLTTSMPTMTHWAQVLANCTL